MSKKREDLTRMIAFFESNGHPAEADMLRQMATLLHDASVIIKHGIEVHTLNPGKILDYGTTTIGNTSAELRGFFTVGDGA